MSWLSKIAKKVESGAKKLAHEVHLQDLDPTSSTSKFGGLVRGAIDAIPGGSAVLGAVKEVGADINAAKHAMASAFPAAVKGATPAPPPKPIVVAAKPKPKGGAGILIVGAAAAYFLLK